MRSKAGAHSCSNFSRVITILLGNGCGQTDAMSTVAAKLLDSFLFGTAFSTCRGPQCCKLYLAVLKCVLEAMHSMQHKPESDELLKAGEACPHATLCHQSKTCSSQSGCASDMQSHAGRMKGAIWALFATVTGYVTFADSQASHSFVPNSSWDSNCRVSTPVWQKSAMKQASNVAMPHGTT